MREVASRSQTYRWEEARGVREKLTDRDERLLELVSLLPLCTVETLASLSSPLSKVGVYRLTQRLEGEGLLASVRPNLGPGLSPRLLHLTDLGLAVLALRLGKDPRELSRERKLRRSDLYSLLARVGELRAAHSLLGALARSRAQEPTLVGWEYPWVRTYQSATAKEPARLRLPARVVLRWDDDRVTDCLLVPDLGRHPILLYRQTIDRLFVFRATRFGADRGFPALLIGVPTEGRASGWRELLEEARCARREEPLRALTVTFGVAEWGDLKGPIDLVDRARGSGARRGSGAERPSAQRSTPTASPSSRPGDGRIPKLVGPSLVQGVAPRSTVGRLGQLALRVTALDRVLLDLVGHHPFVSTDDLALVLDSAREPLRRRRKTLVELGLVRLVDEGEIPSDLGPLAEELWELTRLGLELLAREQGLSLQLAVRLNGLAGGGTDEAVGTRSGLLRYLRHTLGVNSVFCAIHRDLRGFGGGATLLEWRNAAASADAPVYPDGYGVVCLRGAIYGFFLEYDRATARARDYQAKLRAYLEYCLGRRHLRRYDGLPTILFVTRDVKSEETIARACREVDPEGRLPLLLTSGERTGGYVSQYSLLRPVWRHPDAGGERITWPPSVVDLQEHTVAREVEGAVLPGLASVERGRAQGMIGLEARRDPRLVPSDDIGGGVRVP